jgi:acetolactate decarboxylase
MISLQHFFEFSDIKGTLVGQRLPAYMVGPNITGYHLHFIADDHKAGGHIIDVTTGDVTIEVDTLDSFTVELPQTADFADFSFDKDRRAEVKAVENGKKD